MTRRKRERPRSDPNRQTSPRLEGPRASERRGRDLGWLFAVCGLALAIQLVYLVESRDEPTFLRPVVDAAVYDRMARELAAGTFATTTPYYHPPLLPYALGAIYKLSGNSIVAAKLVLAIVGVLSVALTALTAKRLLGPRTGWIAGLMTALCGPLIFYNAQLLPAGLAAMLNILFLWLILRATASGSPALWLAAGVAGGLAADAVPNILFVVPFVLGWLLWRSRARSVLSAVIGPGSLLLAGLAAAILPVTLANYRHSGQFCLISYNGGLNLYIGNNPNADATIAVRPGFDWESLDKFPLRNGVLDPVEQNRFYEAQALAYAREHPGQFIQGLLKKARQLTNARELPRNVDIYTFREWSGVLAATVWRVGPFGFPFGILFPLACLGSIVACRERPEASLLALYVGAYAMSIVAFFIASRYRVVLMPALIVFAAHAVTWSLQRRQDVRRLGPAALLVVVAGIWTNTPVAAPTDGFPFAAEMHNFLALESIRDRDLDRAARDVAAALVRAPRYAEAHHTRGMLRMEQGRLREARDDFRSAVALDPEYAEAHYNLGITLERLGDRSGAESAYREAMRESPEISRIPSSLGTLLLRQARVAEAAPLLRRAIALDAMAYEARGMLAWVLATCPDARYRDGAEAVRQASAILRARGASDPTGMDVLAAGLAESGSYDQAASAQQVAIRGWQLAGHPDVARQGELRLAIYRDRRPFRDPSLGRIDGADGPRGPRAHE